jgi:CDP-glycerol glycerophosphotransferase (TagB/SpsB family)
LKTVAEVKTYNPCAVFVPGNVAPDFFPGIKVQLFHGFPARKRPSANPSKDGKDGDYRVRGMFDLYCTQGPSRTKVYEALSKKYGYFEVVETGWPKMDPLFEVPTRTSLKKNRKVVLLTSTFTPSLSAAPVLFETVRQLAGTGKWKWLVNFHPKMNEGVLEKYRSIQSDNIVFIETDDVIPLLREADIMVSDTSSVISEFLLLQKPVVTFKNRQPGPHLLDIHDPAKLEETIAYGLTRPPKLMQAIRRYMDRVHPYRDGGSSLRVLSATDRMVHKGRGHLKRKPLNLVRCLKLRHRLGYYRFW